MIDLRVEVIYEFEYRGTTYPLDLADFPGSEAVWLERFTGFTMFQAAQSFDAGGAIGTLCYLMLALRRAGAHSLAVWGKLQTINLGSTRELLVHRIPRPQPEPDHAATGEAGEAGDAADPTDPSPSTTPTSSATAAPTAPRSGG